MLQLYLLVTSKSSQIARLPIGEREANAKKHSHKKGGL